MRATIPAKRICDLNPFRDKMAYTNSQLYNEYKAVLMNNVRIIATGEEPLGYIQESFIKSVLIDAGMIGYDKSTNLWALAYGWGLDKYWNPTEIQFVFPNVGRGYRRKASYEPSTDGAYIIKGFPSFLSFGDIIDYDTKIIAHCDSVIKQNLEANRTPRIIVCANKDIMLSLQQAKQETEDGAPILIVSDEMREALQGVPNETNYIVNDVYDYREKVRDRLMNKIGTMTANINKRERVQVGEVNATVGQCEDYIYLMIDTLNKQFETYDLPFKAEVNGSLEELYDGTDGDNLTEPESQVTSPETNSNEDK